MNSTDNHENRDTFTSAVMSKINYLASQSDVERFSADQLALIEQGVLACKPKGHAIDIRGILPLHLFNPYFVFLMGRDKRKSNLNASVESRQNKKPIEHIIYWSVAIWPIYLVFYFSSWILNNLPPLFRG